MKKRYLVIVRLVILALLYRRATTVYGGIQKTLLVFIQRIIAHPFSILLFCCLYILRPFTLIPVGWLSTIAGVLRGWRPGLAIALGGEMISACIAFQNGRLLGPHGLEHKKEEAFGQFSFMLLRYPIVAVVLSRMSPLPDDAVNYGWGMLRISWFTYFWGSLLGNIPFSVLNILMGVQIDPQKLITEGLTEGINLPILLLTGIIYLVVLFISRLLFRKIRREN